MIKSVRLRGRLARYRLRCAARSPADLSGRGIARRPSSRSGAVSRPQFRGTLKSALNAWKADLNAWKAERCLRKFALAVIESSRTARASGGLAVRTSRSILESLRGFARGARPARAIVTRAVELAQPGRPIRRPQQQLEECPVSPVFGSGSAAFRTLHDNLPFGRAHAPPPGPASLLQDHFKNRKLVRHCNRFNSQAEFHICIFHLGAGSKFPCEGEKNSTKSAMPV